MCGLLFGGTFRYDLDRPDHPGNDRLIFSKGHASPLFYALWLAAGRVGEKEMMTYRRFGSRLEGHPTPRFPFAEAATGSLGQGLSIGLGFALCARDLEASPARAWVLLGDSEMSEGSQWEAIQLAAHYGLANLIGILDVNRLGQRGETMYGHDLDAYRSRIRAFGWSTLLIDGHDMDAIVAACAEAADGDRPTMIIARTVKGKGVPLMEDEDGWHGKALDESQLGEALESLGPVDRSLRGTIRKPDPFAARVTAPGAAPPPEYPRNEPVATRDAYGNALKRLAASHPRIVSLDGEVSNSTRAETFREARPDRFFEMYIAEQNMVGAALGMARRGFVPFVSTFAAFLTRAFDQIRMSRYSDGNIKFVGSHAGVSIGEDGPSQMGLEDIAMFRSILDCVVLHPCDAVATERLVEIAAEHEGLLYLRTMRQKTPILYGTDDAFRIGGSRVHRASGNDVGTIVAAGATLFEALGAAEDLEKEGTAVRVIDLYSLQPVDRATLEAAAAETAWILTVEDHYPNGGLGDAVRSALSERFVPVHSLCVRRLPRSGTPGELREFEEISRSAIRDRARSLSRETAVSRPSPKP